jgi:O-antigen/teichoic acid export membrane protein
MNAIKTIAKNTIVMLVARILSYLLGFFSTMYSARYLSADGFGIISLALSLAAILSVMIDPGFSMLTTREVARNKLLSEKYVTNTVVMKIVLSIFMLLFVGCFTHVIGYSSTVKTVVIIIAFSVVISSLTATLNTIFQAEEKMEYISINTILAGIIMLAGVLIGIAYKGGVVYFALLYVITNSLVFLVVMITYSQIYSFPKMKVNFRFWKEIIRESWAFGIIGLSGMLYTYIDSILLSILTDTKTVGWYSAAYRLMLLVLFFPTAINTALFPVMSRYYTSARDSLKKMTERYFKYMIITGIPMGVGTTLLADKIVALVYGNAFTESSIALKILIWTMVFTFSGAAYVQLLVSINKQLEITKISLICVVVNIVLNLLLIPRLSYIGASIATVSTEVILVGYIIFICYKQGYGVAPVSVLKHVFKIAVGAAIMSVFLVYCYAWNVLVLIPAGALVYLIVIYAAGVFDKEDKCLVYKMLRRQ